VFGKEKEKEQLEPRCKEKVLEPLRFHVGSNWSTCCLFVVLNVEIIDFYLNMYFIFQGLFPFGASLCISTT